MGKFTILEYKGKKSRYRYHCADKLGRPTCQGVAAVALNWKVVEEMAMGTKPENCCPTCFPLIGNYVREQKMLAWERQVALVTASPLLVVMQE